LISCSPTRNESSPVPVCTSSPCATTVTSSVRTPVRSSRFTTAGTPSTTRTSGFKAGVKPSRLARTSNRPRGSTGITKRPLGPETTSRVRPVSWCRATTAAPGSTPPEDVAHQTFDGAGGGLGPSESRGQDAQTQSEKSTDVLHDYLFCCRLDVLEAALAARAEVPPGKWAEATVAYGRGAWTVSSEVLAPGPAALISYTSSRFWSRRNSLPFAIAG
jgi:hypothetical protein